jgi:tryptophanyl-tRNA synthetase
LAPIQRKYAEITADPAYLDTILRDGAARIRPIAEETVRLTKQKMGLYV